MFGGLGTYMVLRGLVYWAMAIVIAIVTKGRLGCESTDAQRGMKRKVVAHGHTTWRRHCGIGRGGRRITRARKRRKHEKEERDGRFADRARPYV